MTERQLQFRVGVFVLAALMVLVALIVRFGEMRWMWEEYYPIAVHFDEAPGVHRETTVRKNGIGIGHVRDLIFDEENGGVIVLLNIRKGQTIKKDSHVSLTMSLLGDATVEFTPGKHPENLRPGAKIRGEVPINPLQVVSKMQGQVEETLGAFRNTSLAWEKVATNLNGVLETKRGHIDEVIERTAESLAQLSITLRTTQQLIGDPATQENLRRTLATMPDLVLETQQAIRTIRGAVGKADTALGNIAIFTTPLAERSESLVKHLDSSMANLDIVLKDISLFSQMLADDDGTLKLLATDPELYKNLNRSASSLNTLLKNLEPASADLRVLADKIARHPELLGVRGAIQGSTGLKNPDEDKPATRPTPRTALGADRKRQ